MDKPAKTKIKLPNQLRPFKGAHSFSWLSIMTFSSLVCFHHWVTTCTFSTPAYKGIRLEGDEYQKWISCEMFPLLCCLICNVWCLVILHSSAQGLFGVFITSCLINSHWHHGQKIVNAFVAWRRVSNWEKLIDYTFYRHETFAVVEPMTVLLDRFIQVLMLPASLFRLQYVAISQWTAKSFRSFLDLNDSAYFHCQTFARFADYYDQDYLVSVWFSLLSSWCCRCQEVVALGLWDCSPVIISRLWLNSYLRRLYI